MTDRVIDRSLPEAAQRTLETMFFAVPDSVSASPRLPPGDLIAASLTFRGTQHGRFGVLVSEPLARTLAANFFGCDEGSEMASGHVTGVIAELTNMICGAALTRVESSAAFDLAAPKTFRLSAAEPPPDFAAGAPFVSRLEFPEGTLVLFLSFGTPL
jgi:CheY-specific phosphatase CheX